MLELEALSQGKINLVGQITSASNFVFLVELEINQNSQAEKPLAVYKPIKGERPLWDFPPDLSKRERATYLISEQLGWDLIPTTILREGPLGIGSLQAFIDAKPKTNYLYFTPLDCARYADELERLCALDIVINSTDRQSSHILIDKSEKVWAIDNALTFHTDFKLRTVIWEFAEKDISSEILDDLSNFLSSGPTPELKELLTAQEIEETLNRTNWLLEEKSFPQDPGGHYARPWPL